MNAPSVGCLFWELALEEEASDSVEPRPNDRWYEIVPAKDGDLLIFESSRRSTTLRRFVVASGTFREGQELTLVVHAAVPSPTSPEKACLLHCPSHWGSDHRYEVYSLDASSPDSFLPLEPLFVSSASKAEKEKLVEAGIAQIAPKQRHGFSLAPYDGSLYFLCGLQHFPGDVTGSFVYCFSLEERVWTEVEYTGTFPATKPGLPYHGCRFGQSCVVHGRKAWLFGGCVSNEAGGVQPTNGLFSFDLEEHHFEEVAAASPSNWPPALTAHSSVAFDGKVFVFGGDDGAQDVYCYDIATSTWGLLPPLLLGPRPCDGRVAHALTDRYVVAYQQGSDPASEEPYVEHSLFRISRDQLSRRSETSARDFRDHKPGSLSELDFLLDEATADATFLIDDTRLPVHRAVLRRFAPALAQVVAEKPVVALNGKGVTIPAVQQMLQHVYSRYMEPVSPAEAEMLLKLAHHFQLTPLVQLCQENIVIDSSNVRELLDYASRVTPPLETLNQKCYEFWTSHPEHLSFMKSPVRDRLPSSLPSVGSPELRAATEAEVRSTQSRQHLHEHLQAQLQQLTQPQTYTPASIPGRSVPEPAAGFATYGVPQPAVVSHTRPPTVIQPTQAMSLQLPPSSRPPLPAQANWRPATAQPGVIPGPYAGVAERYYRMMDTGMTGTPASANTTVFQRTVS